MRGEGHCKECPEDAEEYPYHCVHLRRRHGDMICCWCGDLAAVQDECAELSRVLDIVRGERDALIVRRDELLALAARLTRTEPYPEESRNAGVLLAELGTLKARLAKAEQRVQLAETHTRMFAHAADTEKAEAKEWRRRHDEAYTALAESHRLGDEQKRANDEAWVAMNNALPMHMGSLVERVRSLVAERDAALARATAAEQELDAALARVEAHGIRAELFVENETAEAIATFIERYRDSFDDQRDAFNEMTRELKAGAWRTTKGDAGK